jgi:hypothetical protein
MMHILAFVDIYTTDTKMMLRVNFCGFLRHVHVHCPQNSNGEHYKNVQQVADIKILRRAKVIACTTSRAARDIEILETFFTFLDFLLQWS